MWEFTDSSVGLSSPNTPKIPHRNATLVQSLEMSANDYKSLLPYATSNLTNIKLWLVRCCYDMVVPTGGNVRNNDSWVFVQRICVSDILT
jgi:hypothetical protein